MTQTITAPSFVAGLDVIVAWLSEPTVVMIGDVRMLLPAGSPRLTAKTLGLLGKAWIAQSESRLGAVEVNVEKIEAAVWPKGFDPHEHWPVLRDISIVTTDQRRLKERAKVAALTHVHDVHGQLTPADVKGLDAALTRRAKASDPERRSLAAKAVKDISARPKQRIEHRRRAADLTETVALAAGRGETVDTKPQHGAACISNRDGLYGLTRPTQHITADQYRIGLDYRGGYEARGADLKANTIGDGSGGAHDNNHFVGKHFERAKLLAFVARTDRAVLLQCKDHPTALQMIRWVAGQGHSLSAFGEGRALGRNRKALIAALDVATEVAKVMRNEARSAREGVRA